MEEKRKIKITWHRDFIERAVENPITREKVSLELARSKIWRPDKLDLAIMRKQTLN